VAIYNVTFEPGCRNNWHIHHATSGGGQMLICAAADSWFAHLAVEIAGENTSNEWCEPVTDEELER
jgi:4-carboxymuconolactone decarboxylase